MSVVYIGDKQVDSDFEDVWYCDNCEEWNFDDDDCSCGESDQDWDYKQAIKI